MALPEALRDRRKQLWILIFIVLVLMNLILLFSYKQVQVLDIKRRCEKGKCDISFRLHNRTPKQMPTYVMIRAYKRIYAPQSKISRKDMVGEIVRFCELEPREKRAVTIEMLTTVPEADMVSVKAGTKPE